jgi:hypothetical protein
MPAIPSHMPSGLLPVGRHLVVIDDVKTSLVDPFPTSPTRTGIFEWWVSHREALCLVSPVVEQWLDGSFVSTKLDPADIDVVTVLDGPDFDALPLFQQRLTQSLVNGPHTRDFWHCDSYAILRYPAGHPGHADYLARHDYWDDTWGHLGPLDPRGRLPKGFLVIQ